ncbi:MlaA family lipoprotein [Tropicimonas marinistellae]|uniref:MlaA family lipoprotein n=1 Tax=Tropicimonas marinistellae TaxID=1739787 RepID=UPI0013729F2B|nr:VacJ family lipoprotein [Tropicimonas marinistellae]
MTTPLVSQTGYCRRPFSAIGLLSALVALTACGPAAIPTEINDPNEARNREIHAFNKRLDEQILGGGDVAEGGGAALPEIDETEPEALAPEVAPAAPVADAPLAPVSPALIALANFGANLDNPRRIANSLLQVRPGDAAHNTLRLGINSTIGIFGLIDVARAAGLPEIDTDFGETLHVWGVPEGTYQELPVIGPSTQRDTVGMAVDFVGNPLWYIFPWPQNLAANGFTWAGEATDRVRYAETVDSLLYDSADSYAQTRLVYLQNRRFEMSRGEVAEEDYFDPYEELYGDDIDAE